MDRRSIIPEIAGSSGDISVRRYVVGDAESLNAAVDQSREHLSPWLAWAGDPAMTLDERRAQLLKWEAEWLEGGASQYGIFLDEQLVGGGGLHPRLGPEGLEIGYWLHPEYIGRGIMTTAAGLMTSTAFSMLEIGRVEIHHDRANTRSGAVPRRLGFRLVEQEARTPQAPAETGVECRWRITREQWPG